MTWFNIVPLTTGEEMTNPQRAPDNEFVDFLIKHIDNPCQTEVAPGQIANIRDFYLREAERVLPKIKDPVAKQKLADKIKQHRPNTP